jgi:hypothetical protein
MTSTYDAAKPTTGIDLLTVAAGALAEIQALFALNGVELPGRQYVAAGAPASIAWDCEQLVVCLAAVGWGRSVDATQLSPSFGKAASVGAMRHAVLAVQLVRAVPVVQDGAEAPVLPSAEDIQAAGEAAMVDAGLLSQALVNFVAFPNASIPPGGSVQAGAVQPIGPEGGLVGLEAALVITAGQLADPPIPTLPSGSPQWGS